MPLTPTIGKWSSVTVWLPESEFTIASGKTSILIELVPRLKAKGLTVGTIKHTTKDLDDDVAGKDSQPYQPNSPHDFMHNKVVVCDDVVVTGSFNFSRSATFNSENVLIIHSAEVAELFCTSIDGLVSESGKRQ